MISPMSSLATLSPKLKLRFEQHQFSNVNSGCLEIDQQILKWLARLAGVDALDALGTRTVVSTKVHDKVLQCGSGQLTQRVRKPLVKLVQVPEIHRHSLSRGEPSKTRGRRSIRTLNDRTAGKLRASWCGQSSSLQLDARPSAGDVGQPRLCDPPWWRVPDLAEQVRSLRHQAMEECSARTRIIFVVHTVAIHL